VEGLALRNLGNLLYERKVPIPISETEKISVGFSQLSKYFNYYV